MRGFHHHENRHAEKDGLNDRVKMKAGDALQKRAQHLSVQQPRDEDTSLETMKAD